MNKKIDVVNKSRAKKVPVHFAKTTDHVEDYTVPPCDEELTEELLTSLAMAVAFGSSQYCSKEEVSRLRSQVLSMKGEQRALRKSVAELAKRVSALEKSVNSHSSRLIRKIEHEHDSNHVSFTMLCDICEAVDAKVRMNRLLIFLTVAAVAAVFVWGLVRWN